MFVNKFYLTELLVGSSIRESDLFLKRLKFAQYLEKAVRKEVVQKYEGSKLS